MSVMVYISDWLLKVFSLLLHCLYSEKGVSIRFLLYRFLIQDNDFLIFFFIIDICIYSFYYRYRVFIWNVDRKLQSHQLVYDILRHFYEKKQSAISRLARAEAYIAHIEAINLNSWIELTLRRFCILIFMYCKDYKLKFKPTSPGSIISSVTPLILSTQELISSYILFKRRKQTMPSEGSKSVK